MPWFIGDQFLLISYLLPCFLLLVSGKRIFYPPKKRIRLSPAPFEFKKTAFLNRIHARGTNSEKRFLGLRLSANNRRPAMAQVWRLASLEFGFRLAAELSCDNNAQTCGLLCEVRLRLRRMPYGNDFAGVARTRKGHRPFTRTDVKVAF